MKPSLMCPRAWSCVTVLPNQRVPACCASDEDMKNSTAEGVLEAFHGKKMTELRRKLLIGVWPEECFNCSDAERRGQLSLRQETLTYEYYSKWKSKETLTEEAESVVELDLAFSKLCNLKCRMCSPDFSSRWEEDAKHLYHLDVGMVRPTVVEPDVDLESLIPHLADCKSLLLKGGEPSLHPKALKFLRKLIEKQFAQQIALSVVTNCTTINYELIDMMKEFRWQQIIASVDGPDPYFKYIRHGAFTAKQVLENVKIYRKNGLFVTVTLAYQIYNMLVVDKVIEYFRNHMDNFHVTYVSNEPLLAQGAPMFLRNEAIRRLQKIDASNLGPLTQRTIQDLIEFLKNGQFSPRCWGLFKIYTEKLDEIRGENLQTVDEQIYEFMKMPLDKIESMERELTGRS